MELAEIKAKTNKLIELNEELTEIGMCDVLHDGERGYLQCLSEPLVTLAKRLNVELIASNRDCKDYPIDLSIPALKMYAICTGGGWKRLKKELLWEGLKEEIEGDPNA